MWKKSQPTTARMGRQVGALAADDAPADRASGRVERDLAHAVREQDRHEEHEEREEQEEGQLDDTVLGRHAADGAELQGGLPERVGEAGADVHHDDDGHAVADAALGHLLAEPHHQHRGRRHRDHREDLEADAAPGDEGVLEAEGGLGVLEELGDAEGLAGAEHEREVAGRLGELLAADVALARHLLQRRDDRRHELDDDAGVDVGPDRERADGAVGERAAGEEVGHAEQAAALGGVAAQQVRQFRDAGGVEAGRGDDGDEAAEQDQAQREENAGAELGDLPDVAESGHGEKT